MPVLRSLSRSALLAGAALLAVASPSVLAQQNLSVTEQRLVRSVDLNHDATLALLEQLVNINSGTMNLDGVRAVKDVMQPKLEALGFRTRWVPMEAETHRAGDLVAEHPCPTPGKCGKRILLIGHMDTVFEKDSPFQKFAVDPASQGKIASGPGVNDMKGGLVVMLSALRAMKAAGTLAHAHIRIVLSGDEERAARPLAVARHDMIEAGKWADAALEFELLAREKGQDIGSVSRRGSITWTLKTTGHSGHSAGIFNTDGFGANYELARIVDTFRRELREPDLTYSIGIMLGGVSVRPSATTEEAVGGTAEGKANIIAGQGYATGDIRALQRSGAARRGQNARDRR